MTNGSNHWILRQPDQVSRTDTMARETKVLFAVGVKCAIMECDELVRVQLFTHMYNKYI